MQKLTTLSRIYQEKLMAIIRVETIERAQEIVDGCLEGKISCLEISYTNKNAGDIIEQLKVIYQDKIVIGAGTVLDSETARHALLKGAEFIIAPNFNHEVARLCNRYQIPYMPGCTSMTEIVEALEAGADMVKAFPTSSFVGPKVVSTIKTPMPQVPVLSSGGVTLDNVADWLHAGVDCMGIGTLLSKGTQTEIAENARRLRQKVSETLN
ncbi:bifunctional 2-keto-4-hydroxyglutarate aldolase/2-keto-3-deoxy-6-phosphogluconate aldolase [Enterococcus hulanensis]|uniref:Bifunctional 2-keto-4-hydroxyglutarate aldolase/2-keto-3-deoxy-6-phosphogluconate aldolase n=1 Tax=Enterococcus hulanensis TaxID=2559929 RepID=A0ABU3ETV4_9ENTE|nr:bifunctional 2-keto-4-hydroxyglutarate aldolase/2-keto-3-deoxy-6-phosphogluconate aldolase [Enterococcus hulanensis]MDT2598289.1 bifunctional 2-keto-4-hydroxyglutarate aldolase/2-keto-3-deoxy-6-phosphogluconate aldolase [Enterococcus hulanensis]MDT2608206.1 bifunctional 2-keto-4-hydroxyglutarate aldolase/2-keto-3-deoxy-6-phosphogluconate aldolase [Enterococcus hulanensis]MDT2615501.1 bifunctional 2-keto-4-hydroxyglutarate aldolase/2-keto-3-deoxy-6-phosphogluconate aldolase [Enterococcus hulan